MKYSARNKRDQKMKGINDIDKSYICDKHVKKVPSMMYVMISSEDLLINTNSRAQLITDKGNSSHGKIL